MDTAQMLQLEALKMIQEWSIWLIGLSTVFLGMIGFAFKNLNNRQERLAAKYCVIFSLVSVLVAVFLVGAIPALIQKIEPAIYDHFTYFNSNARGVYGLDYLDRIPLWMIVSSQRILFILSVLAGVRLVWLQSSDLQNREPHN